MTDRIDRTLSDEGLALEKERTAPPPDDERKPSSPSELRAGSWKYAIKQAWAEFRRDECTDLAAALTYYAILSMFPALLAMVALLGVFGQGQSTTDTLLELVERIGQEDAVDQLRQPITQMTETNAAGFAFVLGLIGAVWSASGYVGAFGRAMNRIYEVDEGRPFWKLRPLNLVITVVTVVLAAVVLLGLVVTGPFARELGETLGLGDTTVTLWNIVKWPILLLVVVFVVAVLYYATPNVQQPKFRWVSVGAAFAIVVWIVASLGFGLYVANFGSYNQTYGALGGVIILLLWLWLTNLALLLGAEVDAELERSRQLQAGIEAEEALQLPPHDTRRSHRRPPNSRSRSSTVASCGRSPSRRGDGGTTARRGTGAQRHHQHVQAECQHPCGEEQFDPREDAHRQHQDHPRTEAEHREPPGRQPETSGDHGRGNGEHRRHSHRIDVEERVRRTPAERPHAAPWALHRRASAHRRRHRRRTTWR